MKYSILILLFFTLFINSNSQDLKWYQTNGPYGGNFTSIVSLSSDTLIVTDSFKGFHVSVDNGMSWKEIPFSIGHYLTFSDMLINNNQMIVASSIYSQNIFISKNGISWNTIQDVFSTGGPRDLTMDPMGNIYGCNIGVVYKSNNGGFTWESLTKNNLIYTTLEAIIVNDNYDIFVAMHTQGVAVLKNDSDKWETINNGLDNQSGQTFAIDANGTLFFGTDKGIYKFDSDATKWIKTINELQNNNISKLIIVDDIMFASTSGGIYRSEDNGQTWLKTRNSTAINSFTCNESSQIFAATNGEILVSNDSGLNWNEIYNGIISTDIRALESDGSTVYAGTYGNGIYKSNDGGISWSKFNDGLTSYSINDFITDTDSIIAATGRGIYIFSDAANQWLETDFSKYNLSAMSITQTIDKRIYALTWDAGLYKTNLDDLNWSKVEEIPDDQALFWSVISKDSSIIVGGSGIFYSNDLGKNWIKADSLDDDIYSLAFTSQGTLIAGGNGRIFKSIDFAKSWELVYDKAFDYFKDIIVVDTTIIAASRGDGIFISHDEGNSWEKSSEGLRTNDVISLCSDENGIIYAGTYKYGVFSTKEITKIIDEPCQIPKGYLLNNYPNPFNSTTNIPFSIYEKSHISLIIYDILGRKISTLVDDQKEHGKYTVKFNASNLSSGVYYIRLITNKFYETKKMVLIR